MSEIAPLEGKTTVDDKLVFQAQALAYEALQKVNARIAEDCKGRIAGKTVVVADAALFADFGNLATAHAFLTNVSKSYAAIATHAVAPPAATASVAGAATGLIGILTPILGVLSLFRQDVEYHGVGIGVDPLALFVDLSVRLKPNAGKVVIPELMVVRAQGAAPPAPLEVALAGAMAARDAAWRAVGPSLSALARLEADLEAAIAAKDQKAIDALTAQIRSQRRQLDPVSMAITKTDERFDELQRELGKVDTAGFTGLARLLRAERIQRSNPYFLQIRTVTAGGNNQVRRNLFRTLFWSDGLRSTGGVVVEWCLLSATGAIELGGIITESVTR